MLLGKAVPADREIVVGGDLSVLFTDADDSALVDVRADNARVSKVRRGAVETPWVNIDWLDADEMAYVEFDVSVGEFEGTQDIGRLEVTLRPQDVPEWMPDALKAEFVLQAGRVGGLVMVALSSPTYELSGSLHTEDSSQYIDLPVTLEPGREGCVHDVCFDVDLMELLED